MDPNECFEQNRDDLRTLFYGPSPIVAALMERMKSQKVAEMNASIFEHNRVKDSEKWIDVQAPQLGSAENPIDVTPCPDALPPPETP